MDDIPARCMFRIKKIIKNKSKKSLWNAEKLAWVIFQLGACLKLPLVETNTWDLLAKTQKYIYTSSETLNLLLLLC